MMLTAIMFVVLVISFALMFGLVQFSENIVVARRSAPTNGSTAAEIDDTRNALHAK